MDSIKKIVVSHRSGHHSEYSGYTQLIKYLDSPTVIDGKQNISYNFAKFKSRLLFHRGGIYNTRSVFKIEALKNELKNVHQPTVVHFLNAERDIPNLKRLKKQFSISSVATFHKPPTILSESIKSTKYLRQLDGAICVGANQVNFLKEWLGLNRVVYIPHGIDSNFFRPAEGEKKLDRPKLLFVGQHLRDFDTFNNTVKILLEDIPDLWVDVVLKQQYQNKILPNERVAIHSGVSDERLRSLYQEATLLFLPLKDATGCNSLLEALACGLPIVTNDVGGVRDYLKGTANVICEVGDVENCVTSIQSLLFDVEKHRDLVAENIQHAKGFSWETVAEKIELFYKSVIY